MARQRAKVDANHSEIVDALRAVGAGVQSLASVGNGCPDLLVAFRGAWHVLEIKDGSKPPSHRRLTPDEQAWFERFDELAPCYVVCSVEEALEAIGVLDDD